MKPYPAYKDSGIEWIGQIPEEWETKKIKHLLISKKGAIKTGPFGSQLKNSDMTSSGIKVYNQRCVLDNDFDSGLDFISENKFLSLKEFEVNPDDLLITTRGTIGKCAIFPKNKEKGVLHPCLMRIQVNKTMILKEYLQTYIQDSNLFQEDVLNNSNATTIEVIYSETLKNISIPFPKSIHEQKKVLSFIHTKTEQIDTLISKKQKQVELLKEERTAIINQAVTKGLNPDVPMKDSGIEWLGEVPEHWEVVGLTKYLESIVDYRGRTPPKTEEGIFLVTAKNIKGGVIDYTLSQEYVNTADYQTIMSRGYPAVGDVLFTTEAPLGEVANVDNENIALAQRIIKFRGNKAYLDNYFLKYWILSYSFQGDLQRYATGSTALGIKASKLNKLKLVLPPVVEQKLIVSFLGSSHSYIESIISVIQQQINLLQEYRTALISNAVTGKIDVRDTPTAILE